MHMHVQGINKRQGRRRLRGANGLLQSSTPGVKWKGPVGRKSQPAWATAASHHVVYEGGNSS